MHSILTFHIWTSIFAFLILFLAALQACLVYFQNRILRTGKTLASVKFLAPVQTMEKILFHAINLGFILLTASLLSASSVADDLYTVARPFKILFSILAWGFFATLILGRLIAGWRGKTALKWTLAGVVVLMLAYFSSKLILLKHWM